VKIKKGDVVRVLSGKDKGTEGQVMSVDPTRGRIVVDGVHMAKKHQRPTQQVEQGGIIDVAMSIDASNVAVVCPKTGKPGRVGYRIEGDSKVRYHKASGEELS
jgi:large subunit ribosomal protein L24